MIGVISTAGEAAVVQEFFQLFKTPWEPYVEDRRYDAVVMTHGDIPATLDARLVVLYGSRNVDSDHEMVVAHAAAKADWLGWNGVEFPVYRGLTTFQNPGTPLVCRKNSCEVVGFEVREPDRHIVRVGYDLFQEIAFLLTEGQPAEAAHIPTLDIHVSLLKSCMLSAGISFVEVPPMPHGYDFMASLTHDVDFTGIREHKFDLTMWGFVYRGLVGSLVAALRGRPWSKCWRNWQAVFSLPLVYCGLKDDFWLEFDRYRKIERSLRSTFYFIPFKNYPGMNGPDPAPKRRAAKYDLAKIKEQVCDLVEGGCEVGLHGIDAWQNFAKAQIERSKINEITGQSEIGVRMHWLYFSDSSPRILEEAGFAYDSTFGYNDAVGFRSGTTQAFCPLPVEKMLELPLNIQDTALFYPSRMNLSETSAMASCQVLIRSGAEFGGALTVNWHTRSLSPERLWGDFYRKLLEEMQKFRVWFGTAQEVVNWFQARRALRFEQVEFAMEGLQIRISGPPLDGYPPFIVRVYHSKPGAAAGSTTSASMPAYSDILWKGAAELQLF